MLRPLPDLSETPAWEAAGDRPAATGWGVRIQSANRAEACLRRMEPVVLFTPRWSHPQSFLEDIALDLAVGEPALGCRTLSLRPTQGRESPFAWQFLLKVVSQLGDDRWFRGKAKEVAERKGFRHALGEMLDLAQERLPYPVALLLHGAEVLPAGVVEDLFEAWTAYGDRHGDARRCVLLAAGAVDSPALQEVDAHHSHVSDYSEEEAMTRLGTLAGRARWSDLQEAARFSGGTPALVEAFGRHAAATGSLPHEAWSLLQCLGPLSDEIRGVADIVLSDPVLGERLDTLLAGQPLPVEPGIDQRLIASGLVRQVLSRGQFCVALRAPAFGMLVG